MKMVLAIVAVVALIGLVTMMQGEVTGNAARGAAMKLKVLPACKDGGCAYGDTMTLKTMAGFVALSAKDLEYESCHQPQQNGCMPARTVLYPIARNGAPTTGVLYCNANSWIFTAGLIPPCPPEVGDLSLG